jgi:ribonuclease P protein component
MLKKGFRITKQGDFDRVFRSGKPVFFGEIGCRYAKNNLTHVRIGFSLSKKHLSLAVDRNRLRRVLSEAFATAEALWPSDTDIVFFSAKKGASLSFDQAITLVEQTLKNINRSR